VEQQAVLAGLEQARHDEAGTQRAWLARAIEEGADQARIDTCTAFAAEAEEHGYCVECWARSTSWGLYPERPKKIRHRQPGNCPHSRRHR